MNLNIVCESPNMNDTKEKFLNEHNRITKISTNSISKSILLKKVNFGNVPLGYTVHHIILIHPTPNEKISFKVLPYAKNPCIDVYPLKGNVKPGCKFVEIMVIYRPLRYITLNFELQIYMPELSKTQIVQFYAHTKPRYLRKLHEDIYRQKKSVEIKINKFNERKPILLKKVYPKLENKLKADTCKKLAKYKRNSLEWSHKIHLMQIVNDIYNKYEKVHDGHELRGPLNIYLSEMIENKLKLLDSFLHKSKIYQKENDRAMIHHKPKIGFNAKFLSNEELQTITMERKYNWIYYKCSTITTQFKELVERNEPIKLKQRILRTALKYPEAMISFDTDKKWSSYYCKINIFIEAVYRIILKNRLIKVLKKLKDINFDLQMETLQINDNSDKQ